MDKQLSSTPVTTQKLKNACNCKKHSELKSVVFQRLCPSFLSFFPFCISSVSPSHLSCLPGLLLPSLFLSLPAFLHADNAKIKCKKNLLWTSLGKMRHARLLHPRDLLSETRIRWPAAPPGDAYQCQPRTVASGVACSTWLFMKPSNTQSTVSPQFYP